MKSATWDFTDKITIEELDDRLLPEPLRGLGIDSIDITFRCTGYYEPASMYGGPDQIGWPAEGSDDRDILSVVAFDSAMKPVTLDEAQQKAAMAFPGFQMEVNKCELRSPEDDRE